jgi:phosphoribosylformylglycinamidine synthase
MVGVVEDVDHVTPSAFRAEGDRIVLLGENTPEIGGSEYLYVTAGVVAGPPPRVDLLAERSLQRAVLEMIREGLVASAHDCSEGGLACTLVESALGDGEGGFGVSVRLEDQLPPVALLFGEATGRIVLSCDPAHEAQVLETAERHGVPARGIGAVSEPGGTFRVETPTGSVAAPVGELRDAWVQALPEIMDTPSTSGA